MLIELVSLLTVLIVIFCYKSTSNRDYWKKRGVTYVKSPPIFGNLWDLVFFRKTRSQIHKEVYNAGSGEPYIGVISINRPILYIRDPEIIRNVLTKDFPHFNSRGITFNEKKEPLSAHLLSLDGARWRNLRTKLTPTFTSGKMKNMFPLIQECAKELVAVLGPHAARGEIVEMREMLARYTTDVIGTCAFGVQSHSLRNPDAEFRRMGALLLAPSKLGIMKRLIVAVFPKLAGYLPINRNWEKGSTYFLHAIKNSVKYREANNVERKDFLDLLIQIKKEGTIVGLPEEKKNDAFLREIGEIKVNDFEFTDNLLAAQAFLFFVAGFETSSTALSYTLIELSRNPEIQKKLQNEVDIVYEKHDYQFTYEAIMVEMTYLDKVLSESLRMYPPGPIIMRKVSSQYTVPKTNLVLEKGLNILIPVEAIHRDPEFYPNPEKFDPERFTEEVKKKQHNYVYLPFGEGPRNCIGQRFGLLQTKLGLAMLIRNFNFELGPQMPYPPVTAKTSVIILSTEHGTHLRLTARF